MEDRDEASNKRLFANFSDPRADFLEQSPNKLLTKPFVDNTALGSTAKHFEHAPGYPGDSVPDFTGSDSGKAWSLKKNETKDELAHRAGEDLVARLKQPGEDR